MRNFGLSAVALRIGWVYGPGRMTDAIIQPIVRSARGEAYRLDAGAAHRLQFVHIDDVVQAVSCALAAPAPKQHAYNINGADMVQVGRIRELIAEQLPSITAEIGQGVLEGTEIQGVMSIEAAKRDLAWEPAVSFEKGLRDYVDWLQHHAY